MFKDTEEGQTHSFHLDYCKLCMTITNHYENGECARCAAKKGDKEIGKMKITCGNKQKYWLNSRGGRTINDVFPHEGELCVNMYNHFLGMTPIPIPSEEVIKIKHYKNSNEYILGTKVWV